MQQRKIKKLLIINRAAVAIRIIKTCQQLGIYSVVVFTQEDQDAHFVYLADEARELSISGCTGYQNKTELLAIALSTNVDAVHPGYGFLAEDASFAQEVVKHGITWIGPNPEIIKKAGNKSHASSIARRVDIPTIPGFEISINQNHHSAYTTDNAIHTSNMSYPIIVKNPLCGGGHGMHVVNSFNELKKNWNSIIQKCLSPAQSDNLLIEQLITQARHVEVQIAGDGTNIIHLFERNCSLQRRNQKIIEESPCPFISQHLRQKLCTAAVKLAHAMSYDSIGTVEFMVTQDGKYYFMEINPRLQVEHGITELRTGIDLVELQINLAEGKPLAYQQSMVSSHGHAVQCRIYAEIPQKNFMPSTGKITYLNLPDGPFVRHDHCLEIGSTVTNQFDPMIAQLMTFGKTKNHVVQNMISNLEQYCITGIQTNIQFLRTVLQTEEFLTGNITTDILQNNDFVAKLFQSPVPSQQKSYPEICGALFAHAQRQDSNRLVPQASTESDNSLSRWKAKVWD